MTSAEAREKFNDAAAKCREEFAKNRVDYYLTALQSAVAELRDAGEEISLEVRPRLEFAAHAGKDKTYANAAVLLGGRRVEWIVAPGDEKDTTLMTCVAGHCTVARFYSHKQSRTGEWNDYPKKEELKDAIQAAIFRIKAEREVLSGYDVPECPVTIAKSLSVPAPLRLQKRREDLN